MGTTFGEWLCLLLPWHKYRTVRRLSGQSELVECKHCKRLWAMNHDVHAILPWHEVKDFHERLERDIAAIVAQHSPT